MDRFGAASISTSRLREALVAALDGRDSRDEVQAAARELVTQLREADAPPERMLLAIKQLLAEAGLRATNVARVEAELLGSEATLYSDVIAWSIRYYYETSGK